MKHIPLWGASFCLVGSVLTGLFTEPSDFDQINCVIFAVNWWFYAFFDKNSL